MAVAHAPPQQAQARKRHGAPGRAAAPARSAAPPGTATAQQDRLGNRAAQRRRSTAGSGPVMRACAGCGGGGGASEQKTAAPVMRACASCGGQMQDAPVMRACGPAADQPVMRLCAGCAAEEGIARAAAGSAAPDTAKAEVAKVVTSPGQPLEPGVREDMEGRFGHDFSHVRIHTDPTAALSSQALDARAYTVGSHIAFAPDQFAPGSSEGKRLLAHELAHTVQQDQGSLGVMRAGTVSQPGDHLEKQADHMAAAALGGGPMPAASPAPGGLVARDIIPDWAKEAAGDVYDYGAEKVEGAVDTAVELGEDAIELGEEAVDAAVELGEDAIELGEEAVDAVVEFGEEAIAEVRALAAALGVSFDITDEGLVIETEAAQICDLHAFDLPVPELPRLSIPLLMGAIDLGPVIIVGDVNVGFTLIPQVQAQLGPCYLSGVRIVINPLTDYYSVSGGFQFAIGASLGAELDASVRGEVTAIVILPFAPPIPVPIPVAAIEAGLAGFARGSIVEDISVGGRLTYDGGDIGLDYGQVADLGVAIDLGLAGFGALEVLGINLCRLYWPLWEYHDEWAATVMLGIQLDVGAGGSSVDISAGAAVFPANFLDLPMAMDRSMFSDDCPICDWLYALGMMPSQNGTSAFKNPGRRHPGPLKAFERDPRRASGALCRGACGVDCDPCSPPRDEYVCEDMGNGYHRFWKYPNYTICNTAEGCREHDACYDWCAAGGFTSIFGPCHRLCDLEAVCNYGLKTAVHWAMGGGPSDGTIPFSDAPVITGSCRGPCPEPAGEDSAAPRRYCLPEIQLFDRRGVSDSVRAKSKQIPLFTKVVPVPYIGPVVLHVYARGEAAASVGAGIGPGWLSDVCLVVDPTTGVYKGTAKVHIQADLDGKVSLTGILGGNASWACLIDVVNIEAGLKGTGKGQLVTTLTDSVELSCQKGELMLTNSFTLDPCLKLGFDLDALLRLKLFGFEVFSDSWNLKKVRWKKCWPMDLGMISQPLPVGMPAIPPSFDARGFAVTDVLKQLLGDNAPLNVEAADFPDDPAVASGLDNPCGGEVDPDDECGSQHLPLTRVTHSAGGHGQGFRVTASPLSKCQGNTEGSEPTVRFPPWACIRQHGQEALWVHAHLLHGKTSSSGDRNLHGPGDEEWNLIISDKTINGCMSRNAERDAIRRVFDNDEVLWYKTQVRYMPGGGDFDYYAEHAEVTYGTYDTSTNTEGPQLGSASCDRNPARVPPSCP